MPALQGLASTPFRDLRNQDLGPQVAKCLPVRGKRMSGPPDWQRQSRHRRRLTAPVSRRLPLLRHGRGQARLPSPA